ncbi:MAG TPA: hypothetical protein VLF89_02755 [Candidatus Saccharimonadales bacterium]|nr:hypothetical protein [Candidatus Saccharimonadales bacterium]
MIQDILGLTKVLMVVPSVKDDNKSIELALEMAEQELHGLPVKRYKHNNTISVLYSNRPWKDPHFKVILNINVDVLPGEKKILNLMRKMENYMGEE